MCQKCDKEVIEMDILESDLPNLPYKLVWWYCMVEGCKCKTKMRDYGIPPIYYWPVRIIREKDGSWRGGWTIATHGYICSKHLKEYKQRGRQFFRDNITTEEKLLAKVVPIIKSKQYRS